MKPTLLLLLGPTGVGKSTVVRHLEFLDSRFRYIRPFTTRALRPAETDKVFVTDSEMDLLWQEGRLLVVNSLYGVRYGTPRSPIEEAFRGKLFPVIDWPIQQIQIMNEAYSGQLLRVYIKPPDFDTLRQRLCERNDFDSRVTVAQQELESLEAEHFKGNIDLIVQNDSNLSENTASIILSHYLSVSGNQPTNT